MTTTINADDGVVSGSAGLKYSSDSSGVLALQTNGTTAVSISTGQVVTLAQVLPEASGGTGTTVGYNGFKNRLINSAMVIDQRKAGASVTVNTATRVYGVDRFFGFGQSTDGVFTLQQDTDVPTGFKNSLKVTTTTADASVGASQFYLLGQSIEGFNFYDLDWGTANAKTITLSFWVRSSLTGQFGGSLMNGANNRSYPYSYTINTANTWEQKSITIAGDTTGTWVGATNGIGVNVWFDLGCGSSNIGTAGAWAGAAYYGATGDTKLISTLSADLYITGVQLEKGSTATSFDYRPYGTELALCQRYLPCMNGNTGERIPSIALNTTQVYSVFNFGVEPRVPPTGITVTTVGNFSLFNYRTGAGTGAITAIAFAVAGKLTGTVVITTSSVAANDTCNLYPAASGQILFTGCEL